MKRILVSSLILLPLSANAGESHILFQNARPLGMGGAFVAVSDDANAAFFNPAGLTGVDRKKRLELINPLVTVSDTGVNLLKQALEIDTNNNNEIEQFADNAFGETIHAQVSLYPNYTTKNWSFGLFTNTMPTFRVRNPGNPQLYTDAISDVGVQLSHGRHLALDELSIGASLKAIKRFSANDVLSSSDIVNRVDGNADYDPIQDLQEGFAVTTDLGAIYEFPVTAAPAIGLSINNAITQGFNNSFEIFSDNKGQPAALQRSVNLGFSVRPELGFIDTVLAFDIQDITNGGELNSNKLHAGAEIYLPAILSFRTGINQGYLTGGVTADLRAIRFDLATYAVELGAFAGQRPDRRYTGQMTVGF